MSTLRRYFSGFLLLVIACVIFALMSHEWLLRRTTCYITGNRFINDTWGRPDHCMTHSYKPPKNYQIEHNNKSTGNTKTYLITWHNIPFYINVRPHETNRGFGTCRYNNCILSNNKSDIPRSDAVMFKGREIPKVYRYKRPNRQVWIFAEDESPLTYHYGGGHYTNPFWRSAFNWTMTYDKTVADIYLPYGELWKRTTMATRDYLTIARSKTKSAIFISSHCNTESKRESYINKLKKYIDIDILGSCGRKWNCGKLWIHDKCFEILNSTYRFYLAFENALCHNYVTEKLFDNFNYDMIQISRSGKPLTTNDFLPTDAYINTYNYSSIDKLGTYLQYLNTNDTAYARLLQEKSQYYFPGYQEVYQRAMCNICERMNNQDKYRKRIVDLRQWKASFSSGNGSSCSRPIDV